MADDPIWGPNVTRFPAGGSGGGRPALWRGNGGWDEENLPKRKWIVRGYLMRGAVTLIVGSGAAGKSMLLKAWCCAALLGSRFGRFVCDDPLRVLSYNVEDDREEEQRRISATLRQFERTPYDFGDRLELCGPNDVGTLFEFDRANRFLVATPSMEELEALIIEHKPDIVFLDPLAELHSSEENDNTGLRAVIAGLRSLAQRYNCAIVLVHHMRKGALAPGDPDSARGAGSIVNACRCVFTLGTMSSEDAQSLGIGEDRRKNFMRLDDAKANYSAPGEAEWFERVAYSLDNGDVVAAAAPWSPPMRTLDAGDVDRLLRAIATASLPLSPRLSDSSRSFSEACRRIGIVSEMEQRKALKLLKREHGVTEVRFTRPGKAPGDSVIGLRTAAGEPFTAEWEED